MSFDERLAERVCKRLRQRDGLSEKRLVGGLPSFCTATVALADHPF
jgi:hypothetical protein